MSNFLMLVLCVLAGLLLRRAGRAADKAHQALNVVMVHPPSPAVTLRTLHDFEFDREHLMPVAMLWLLFAVGIVLFWALGRAMCLSRPQVGALTPVGGFGNTSFVGLPMIETLHGKEAAAWHAGVDSVTGREMLRRVVTFPPVIALVVALLLRPLPFPARATPRSVTSATRVRRWRCCR